MVTWVRSQKDRLAVPLARHYLLTAQGMSRPYPVTDKSRGHILEMICADFLAGASLEAGHTDGLLFSLQRLFGLLPPSQQQESLGKVAVLS